MYHVELSKKADKFLRKQPLKIKTMVTKKLLQLAEDPDRSTLDIKKLAGAENTYRLRIGKIRALYRKYEDEILIFVFDIGFRGDIYK
jgi:mRNA interferase RelE/StbE